MCTVHGAAFAFAFAVIFIYKFPYFASLCLSLSLSCGPFFEVRDETTQRGGTFSWMDRWIDGWMDGPADGDRYDGSAAVLTRHFYR
jgi:hypothetical protein